MARVTTHTDHVTIPVTGILRDPRALGRLAASGCLVVTSDVASFDDEVLTILQKGHTRADIVAAVELCHRAGLVLNPTLSAFHPWTTRRSLVDMFLLMTDLDLADVVAPTQLTTRLQTVAGSTLDDPDIDALHGRFEALVDLGRSLRMRRHQMFEILYALARTS